MALTAGTRLGAYEITGSIGAGGMGEVYRARDTRLDRTAAIKVLPELFGTDPDRLARFEREARTLAALNHPNVAQIFGIVDLRSEDGRHAIAMEFVDGEDLSQRLQRGALPVDEAIAVATQVADALEAAHEQGIIHRDLKPANVKVRGDGTVKVLDFGLAKALSAVDEGPARAGPSGMMNSPTFTSPAMTQMGVILGTAAYMSPEQARGRAVDRRSDIWAFGCLLYEMLTGRGPFGGDDVSLTLAAVLKEDADFTKLPPHTPEPLRRLLRRCLQKDPRKRMSAIGDARLELQDAAAEPAERNAVHPPAPGWRRPLAWAAAGALLASATFAVVTALRPAPAASASVVRSQISFPSTTLTLGATRALAIDPSGTELVFAGSDGEQSRLYRRRLADDRVVAIAGTDGAVGPFLSADGRWLGFVQQGRLKVIPASGGGSVDYGAAPGSQGASFSSTGAVVFNPSHGEALVRMDAPGSERTALTTVQRDKGEAGHHWPHILPGGTHALFTVEIDGKPYSDARIELLSLETGERRVLIDGGTDARYVSTGHIVYWRENDVWSVPFDLERLQIAGSAVSVIQNVMISEANGHALFSVAENGTLVYVSGRDVREEQAVMLVDRRGEARQLGERRAFQSVHASPDGRRAVVTIVAANDSLWTMELDRLSLTRITYEAETSIPALSPDGSRLVLSRHRGGEPPQLFVMPSDGSAAPERLRESSREEYAGSWTANGNLLVFTRIEPSGPDIWVAEVDGEREARPFLATRFAENHPRFSPDGRWIAYQSDESGRFEVYVRPFPGPGQKWLVSNGGGTEPRWRGDGREIFYRSRDAVLATDVTLAPRFTAGEPRVLFKGPFEEDGFWPMWDALPDGQAFLMIQDFSQPRTAVMVVQNWFEELRRRP